MDIPLDTFIKLVTFTSGRRIHALRKVRVVAEEFGHKALVQRIDEALEDDRETRALDNRWAGNTGRPTYGPEVTELDNWVDQLLTSLRDGAAAFTKGAFEGTEQATQARYLLDTTFPTGLQAITSLPYIDQVAAVEVMLEDLQGKLASQVAALGLSTLVDRLGALTAKYREAVDRGQDKLEYPTVLAARKLGQRNLLEIVAMVAGAYYSHTNPAHVTRRAALLEPILEQDRMIRAIITARRVVPDIDPDAPEPDASDGGSDGGSDGAPDGNPEEPGDSQ